MRPHCVLSMWEQQEEREKIMASQDSFTKVPVDPSQLLGREKFLFRWLIILSQVLQKSQTLLLWHSETFQFVNSESQFSLLLSPPPLFCFHVFLPPSPSSPFLHFCTIVKYPLGKCVQAIQVSWPTNVVGYVHELPNTEPDLPSWTKSYLAFDV